MDDEENGVDTEDGTGNDANDTPTNETTNTDVDDEENGVDTEDDTSTDETTNEDDDTSFGGGSSSSDNDEDTSDDVDEESGENASTTDKFDADEATTTDDVSDNFDEEATTTDEVVYEDAVAISQNITNKYTFGEGECTLVSDGEFYCVADGPEKQILGDPQVYSEKDREGDREIYYFDGIEVVRITNNSYDDFAPVFEEKTMRVVWQAMLNDRLQIMTHDIPTNTTRQITTSRQNSSNPDIEGNTVVWQEWVKSNWEVMVTDVDNNGQEFEIEQLTDNAVHDMFPQAYNDLVTWQSEKGGSWEVIVYDVRTGKQHALKKSEDTKYENPRFALLFDSKHDNGDVELIGYDLNTGEMMELGTKAKPIPAEPLTPNDETPEALIREATNSTQIKVEDGDEDGNDIGTDDVVL